MLLQDPNPTHTHTAHTHIEVTTTPSFPPSPPPLNPPGSPLLTLQITPQTEAPLAAVHGTTPRLAAPGCPAAAAALPSSSGSEAEIGPVSQ